MGRRRFDRKAPRHLRGNSSAIEKTSTPQVLPPQKIASIRDEPNIRRSNHEYYHRVDQRAVIPRINLARHPFHSFCLPTYIACPRGSGMNCTKQEATLVL